MSTKKGWILLVSGAVILLAGGSLWGFSRWKSREITVCEIQGNTGVSPYLDQDVTVRGLVNDLVSTIHPEGLYLVDVDCGSPEGSSSGIYVQISGEFDSFQGGDEILLKGSVLEVEGETRIQTTSNQVQVISLGNPLPPVVNLSTSIQEDALDFSYEEWEGMFVSLERGSILGNLPGGSHQKFIPDLVPPPGSQLICQRDESIVLGLHGRDSIVTKSSLEIGTTVDELVGYIRQNTSGYWIEVVEIKIVEEIDRKLEVVHSGDVDRPTAGGDRPSLSPTITSTPASGLTSTVHPQPTVLPSPTWYPVNLLITEVMPNPVGKEPSGEWLEIYNPEPYGIPLTGIKIGDETNRSGKEGMLRFPDGFYIQKYDVLVIAHHAGAFRSRFGFLPDFEIENSLGSVPDLLPYEGWGRSGIQFSNSGDEVLLLDPWDHPVDILVYGKGAGEGFSEPPRSPVEGNSLERYPPEQDRDRGSDWRERSAPSPGRLDRSPSTQQATVTPTIIPSPMATESPTDTISPSTTESPPPSGTPSSTGTSLPPTVTPTPFASATLTSSLEATIIPSQTEVPSPTINASATIEASQTSTPEGTVEPTVSKTPGGIETNVPSPTEQSTGTSTALPTITSTPPASMTPEPTPSLTPRPTDQVIPGLILNEIHADPDPDLGDANGDGVVSSDDDEFIELVNPGVDVLDLSGWQIEDSLKTRFFLPVETLLNPGCALVLFGGGEPQGEFGGSLVLITSSLGMNNSGDTIVIRNPDGVVQISAVYGGEGGQNQSLTNYPDLVGENGMVLHGEIAEAQGRLYSPGTQVDGTPFDCGQ